VRRRAPTIKDIAAEAGVSKSAVSRALLGQGEVSEDARRRIETAAQRLGYVANAMAAGLRSRTKSIGVVVRDVTRPYYGVLFAAMQAQAERRGYLLVTATSAEDLDISNAIGVVRSLISLQVDGLILASTQLDSERIAPFVPRLPMVVAGRMELGSAVSGVYSDDQDGGSVLAAHVLASGHRRVAVGLVDEAYSLSQNIRGRAMIDRLRGGGAEAVVIDVPDDKHMAGSVDGILADGAITALMCPTDAGMMDALEAMRVRGMACPDDLSVTGYDGLGGLANPYLGLTTYRQPVEDIGAHAVDMVVDAIERPGRPVTHISLPGHLVPGRTVSPPARR